MNGLTRNITLASLSLATVFSVSAAAQAISLGSLINGGSLTVLDKSLTNWTLVSNPGNINLNLIEVTPLNDDPLNPGIEYTGNISLTGSPNTNINNPDSLTLEFAYTVATVSGNPLIKDNSLALTGYSFSGSGGAVSVVETVNGGLLGNNIVYRDNAQNIDQLTSSLNFASPQSQLNINNLILLIADTAGSTSTITTFEQRFSQVNVPEPSMLFGVVTATVLGLGTLSKSKSSKNKKEQDFGKA